MLVNGRDEVARWCCVAILGVARWSFPPVAPDHLPADPAALGREGHLRYVPLGCGYRGQLPADGPDAPALRGQRGA